MEEAQRCRRVADSMERRGIDPRLVEAAALGPRLTAEQALTAVDERQALEDGVRAFLERVYPDALPLQIEWAHDEEHSRSTPTLKALGAAVERRVMLDSTLLESPDYERFLRLGERTRELGGGPFRVRVGEVDEEIPSARYLLAHVLELGGRGQYVQRYKGLGEMNPEQLWETTMDPARRQLLQVRIEDGVEADRVFTVLMGDDVEPRKEFIEENALNALNLDI